MTEQPKKRGRPPKEGSEATSYLHLRLTDEHREIVRKVVDALKTDPLTASKITKALNARRD